MPKGLKVIFIGVVSIGWCCLKALLESGANVAGIFTADKEELVKKSEMSPEYFCEFDEFNIPIYKTLDAEKIRELQPDIIFCIGWSEIIRWEILEIPPYGCVGIHPSLLPKRRGGAPINWALIDGLTSSGVTLFYMDEGIDSGDIIAQREFGITSEDNAGTVLEKVTRIAEELIREYYPLIEKGIAPRIPQDDSKATYTPRRRPEDGLIDWSKSPAEIHNFIRALAKPFPGAFTYKNGEKLIIWNPEDSE